MPVVSVSSTMNSERSGPATTGGGALVEALGCDGAVAAKAKAVCGDGPLAYAAFL